MAFTAGSFYQREKFIESDPGQATRWQIRGSTTFIAVHLGPIPPTLEKSFSSRKGSLGGLSYTGHENV